MTPPVCGCVQDPERAPCPRPAPGRSLCWPCWSARENGKVCPHCPWCGLGLAGLVAGEKHPARCWKNPATRNPEIEAALDELGPHPLDDPRRNHAMLVDAGLRPAASSRDPDVYERHGGAPGEGA